MANNEMTMEEKIKAYEGLFEELMDKEIKKEGKVLAGPDPKYNLFKVKIGNDEMLCKSPNLKCKGGDSVIVIKNVIVERLPDQLKAVEEDEVEFKRIEWNNIGGMKSQIENIRKKVEFPQKYRHIYKEFNLSPSKGLLLYGPPGCGKTLIAKAIASAMLKSDNITKKMFIYLKGGELLSSFVGEAELRIKNIFESARTTYKKTKMRPIIFIDEAEAILPPRGSRVSSDVDTTIVPTFLSEMDGFEGFNPYVMLATNYEERIDSAILRPGRIDLKVYVGRPTMDDSVEIFRIHLAKTKIADNIEKLAVALPNTYLA